jgi:nicotinate (nicotinamide) nucleotide adenylyltransferase
MRKILLYPGAFNPPHLGHESLIKTALDKIPFDEVWIMPSGNRADKVIAISFADRRALGQLFVESVQSKVSAIIKLITTEIDEGNTKSTSQLIHELLNKLEAQPDIELTQLIGMDGLEFLARKYGANLEEGGRYLAVERKGYQLEAAVNPTKVTFLEDKDQIGLSSTQVRELAKNGETRYKELVSAPIADYIEQHRLYQ